MTKKTSGECNSKHQKLISWVKEMSALCQPEKVFRCQGSDEENQRLCDLVVKSGTFKLNAQKRPGSYLARSHPSDVARVDGLTFFAAKHFARGIMSRLRSPRL